jgi:hypothetical protein
MVMLFDLWPKKKNMCAYNANFSKHIHNENMHKNI